MAVFNLACFLAESVFSNESQGFFPPPQTRWRERQPGTSGCAGPNVCPLHARSVPKYILVSLAVFAVDLFGGLDAGRHRRLGDAGPAEALRPDALEALWEADFLQLCATVEGPCA